MPLAMLVPPKYRGGAPVVPEIDELTANIDFAPTILDFAGVAELHSVEDVPGDGRRRCRCSTGRARPATDRWRLAARERAAPARELVRSNVRRASLPVRPRHLAADFARAVRPMRELYDWLYVRAQPARSPTPGRSALCYRRAPSGSRGYDPEPESDPYRG